MAGIHEFILGQGPFEISGTATLVAGTVTVNTTAVDSNSIILLTHQNASGTIGVLSVGTIIANTSFVIDSSNSSDTSDIGWVIINQ